MDDPFGPVGPSNNRTFGARRPHRRAPQQTVPKVQRDRGSHDPISSPFVTPTRRTKLDRTGTNTPASGKSRRSDGSASALSGPSTPRRRIEQHSTPSSSPSSQIDLSKDIYELLSPKKARKDTPSQRSLSDFDDDDHASDAFDDRLHVGSHPAPSRHSFASHMASRKRQKHDARRESSDEETTASPAHDSALSSHLPISEPLTPRRRAQMNARFAKVYGTSEAVQASSSTQADALNILERPKERADATSMRAQWSNLEEMEEEDDPVDGGQGPSADVRSILTLRSAGTSLRSTEEIDYLLMGLNKSNRLGARQATCFEIVKLTMGIEGGERDSPASDDAAEWEPPAPHRTPFICQLRETNMVEPLLTAMCRGGAGEGQDFTLDLCLAMAYDRLLDGLSLDDLAEPVPLLGSLERMISSTYPSPTKKEKHSPKLLFWAQRLTGSRSSGERADLLQLLAIPVMISLLQAPTSFPIKDEAVEKALQSFDATLWDSFVRRRWASKQLDDHALSLAIPLCQCLHLFYQHLPRTEDLVHAHFVALSQLLAHIHLDDMPTDSAPDNKDGKGMLLLLSTILHLVIALTNRHQLKHCRLFLASNEATMCNLASLVCRTSMMAAEVGTEDVRGVQLLDLAALALSILTDLLQKMQGKAIRQLSRKEGDLNHRDGMDPVQTMGHHFMQLLQRKDHSPSRLFAGCLAFPLAMLYLGGLDDEHDDEMSKAATSVRASLLAVADEAGGQSETQMHDCLVEGLELLAGSDTTAVDLTTSASQPDVQAPSLSDEHPAENLKDIATGEQQNRRMVMLLLQRLKDAKATTAIE